MAEQDLTAEQIDQFRMHSYKFGGQHAHNFSVLCRMAGRTAEVEARCREMEKTITMSSGVALEGVTKAISRGETLQSEIAALRKAVEAVKAEPLGYVTERDHEVLENYADRIIRILESAALRAAGGGA